MLNLLASIFFSTLTVCMFMVFERKAVNTFQAIVFNYLTCAILGNFISTQSILTLQVWQTQWFMYAIILGLLFIAVFNFIAQTAQKLGVSTSMVAAKLSVVMPVIASVLLYGDLLNVFKVIGIFISLIAVYFISRREDKVTHQPKNLFYLPFLVFIGSGFIDTFLNYIEQHFIPPFNAATIVTTIFLIAFVAGFIVLIILLLKRKTVFEWRNIVWGILLGLPNYFSMYFLVKTLGEFDGSYIFPLNNIGIVAASTATGVILFKENLTLANKIGLAMAVLAILFISFSDVVFR